MIRIALRWKIVLQPWCWLNDHRWEDYAVIHPGWNWPGRFCHRCRLSVIYHTPWVAEDTENESRRMVPGVTEERPEPWIKVSR